MKLNFFNHYYTNNVILLYFQGVLLIKKSVQINSLKSYISEIARVTVSKKVIIKATGKN